MVLGFHLKLHVISCMFIFTSFNIHTILCWSLWNPYSSYSTTRVGVVGMWFENQNMMKTMLISSPCLLRGNQPLLQLVWKLKIPCTTHYGKINNIPFVLPMFKMSLSFPLSIIWAYIIAANKIVHLNHTNHHEVFIYAIRRDL